MGSEIFRKIALERLSTPEQLDQALALAPTINKITIYTTLFVIILIILASFLVSVPIMAKGQGIVMATEGVAEISAQHAGRVRQMFVSPGQHVSSGQIIAELVQPEQEDTLKTIQSELSDVIEQKRKISEFHYRDAQVQLSQRQQRKRELKQRILSTSQRIKWLEERQQQDEILVKDGFLSRNKLQDTRTELLQTQDRLAELDSQLRSIEVEETVDNHARQREILELELRLASLRHRIGEIQEKLHRESKITSLHEGVIAELKVNAGDVISAGTPIVALLPEKRNDEFKQKKNPTAIIAYLAPGEAKKVKSEMQARVTPNNFKKEEFGSIVASVISVSTIPATSEGMQRVLRNRQLVQSLVQNTTPIEVLLKLEPDEENPSGLRWTSRGPDTTIDFGTMVEVEVVVKRVRLIVLILPALERWLAL
jgi:HlyD family secretion protein